MGPILFFLFFIIIPLSGQKFVYEPHTIHSTHTFHFNTHTFQSPGLNTNFGTHTFPTHDFASQSAPLISSKSWTGRKAFRSYSQTVNGLTETTIWYYNSNGPNFKFKVTGGLPASKDSMIDWIEANYKRYNVIHVPYEGDVADTPVVPTPAPTYPTYPRPPPTYQTYPTNPKPPPTYPTYPPSVAPTTTTVTTTQRPQTQRPVGLKWNEILPSECGHSGFYLEKQVHGKVVGATPAPIELNPWQVALVDAASKALKCGGTIITKNHVLTASHCFLSAKRTVGDDGKIFEKDHIVPKHQRIIYAGDEKISKPAAVYKIAELFLHTKYSNSHRRNDIALILIDGEFSWSTRIYPICLPSSKAAYTPTRACRVSGWGQKASENLSTEEYLQAAIINIIEPKKCSENYEGHLGISKGMFCAAGFDKNLGRTDTCQGDSGGPCTCDENDRGTLYGITSWGIGCGRENYPGVYVKVALYLGWIRDRLEVSIGSRSRSSLTYDEDVGESEEQQADADPDADIV